MADIFLSYKREDGVRAQDIANALRLAGRSVFFDLNIPVGDHWDERIEQELEASKAVLVLWSSRSVESKWVRNEARFADERRRLFPAMIERCRIPLEFNHVQAADLTAWDGQPDHKEWRRIVDQMGRLIDNTSPDPRYDVASTHVGVTNMDPLRRIWCEALTERAATIEASAETVAVKLPPWWVLREVERLSLLAIVAGVVWSVLLWPMVVLSAPVWMPLDILSKRRKRENIFRLAAEMRLRGESGAFPRDPSLFWHELSMHVRYSNHGRDHVQDWFVQLVLALNSRRYRHRDAIMRRLEAIRIQNGIAYERAASRGGRITFMSPEEQVLREIVAEQRR